MSRYLNGCRERKRERVKQLLFLRILYRNCIVTNSLNNNKQFDPSASYTQLLILCIILLSFLRSYNNYPFDKNLDDIINSLSRIQILQKKKKKRNNNPSYNETLVKTPLVPRNSFRKRSSFPPPDFPNRKPDYPARNRAAFDEAENAILQSITRDEGRRWSARMAKRRQRRIAVTDPLHLPPNRIWTGIARATHLRRIQFGNEWLPITRYRGMKFGWRLRSFVMRPAHVYEYLRRADGQRRPAQGSLLRVAFWGWRRREGWKKEKKRERKWRMLHGSTISRRKKGGIEVGGIEIAFDGLPLFLSFFFLLTLDEEQNFACN